MEYKTLAMFVISLLICLFGNFSIIYALIATLFIFGFYAFRQGFSVKDILKMYLKGLNGARNILITFVLIGVLTAFWRASGTLAALVTYASSLIHSSVFYVSAFLLNCIVSHLTGTAFGSAAIMGCVCTSIAETMNCSILLTGGTVLSGIYFGDRCSNVSTSAMLVADLTQTDVQKNIPQMFHTALIPFVLSCIFYLLPGLILPTKTSSPQFITQISIWFHVRPIMLLPAIVTLILPLLHVRTKMTIFFSILSAILLCTLLQHITISELIRTAILGYHCSLESLSKFMSGGGIISMLKVGGIVGISSCFSVIFQETNLLVGFQSGIRKFSKRTNSAIVMMIVSVIVSAVACNQTLSIMLTHQLCSNIVSGRQTEAITLENTVVVIAPLIPWGIASAVPLTTIDAPMTSILFACYLYFLPLWHIFRCQITSN